MKNSNNYSKVLPIAKDIQRRARALGIHTIIDYHPNFNYMTIIVMRKELLFNYQAKQKAHYGSQAHEFGETWIRNQQDAEEWLEKVLAYCEHHEYD